MKVDFRAWTILGLGLAYSYLSHAKLDECQKWFERAKISPGSECVVECSVAPVDMGCFDWPSRCPDLCGSSKKEKMVFTIANIYPGLSAAERALAAQNPARVLRAYQLSWDAETICLKNYYRMERNDESDACRHFVWAALMTREFGSKFAQQVLDAHETEPSQPPGEKAMDLANNQRGVTWVKDRDKEKKLSDEIILNEFERQLKVGKIVVLKRRLSKEVRP